MKLWNELSKKGKKQRLNTVEPYVGLNTGDKNAYDNFCYYNARYEQETDKNELDLEKARESILIINNDWIREMIR